MRTLTNNDDHVIVTLLYTDGALALVFSQKYMLELLMIQDY